MERFFGILIEHYAGALPSWLAPTQAMLIPISDDQLPYAEKVQAELAAAGLRVEIDAAAERMQAKIARATAQRVPYMLIMGKKEAEEGVVALRHRTEGDQGAESVTDFISRIAGERPA
jgi:threonyl-tRNA synthetase